MDITCCIDGCAAPVVARGWCRRHYGRWRRCGDPLALKRLYAAPLAERFAFLATPPDENGCITLSTWNGDGQDYCRLKVDGKTLKGHRVAWELAHGPIPGGAHVLHRCDHPSCCNAEHLFLGTHRDNMADMRVKGRGNFDGLRAAEDPAQIRAARRERAERRRAEAALSAGVPADWKFCRSCETFKNPADFGPNAGRSDGLQVYCRPCRLSRNRGRSRP